MSEPRHQTLVRSAEKTGFMRGLRVAADLANKMLRQTPDKKEYRAELVRLLNEQERER